MTPESIKDWREEDNKVQNEPMDSEYNKPGDKPHSVKQEEPKAEQVPHMVGILSLKPANAWMEDAATRPNPRLFFNGLIAEHENTVIFASTNVGKSILAVQIAEDIAAVEKVVYLDLELSDKQFQLRYTDEATGKFHMFPVNFIRAEIAPELITGDKLEQSILDSIEKAAKQKIVFFLIDNVTFICRANEKSAPASEFMMKLLKLRMKYGLTTIVIAHTPKRRSNAPITINDLAGSARLGDFFDAGIAMANSIRDSKIRYLKQVKVRSGEYKYDSDNVLVYDLVKEEGYLHFKEKGRAHEYEHLVSDNIEEIYSVLREQNKGKSLRAIAEEKGMSLGKVQRCIQKAKKENITLPAKDTDDVSSVSDVSAVSDEEKSDTNDTGNTSDTGNTPSKQEADSQCGVNS